MTGPYQASRYTHLVELEDGRVVAFNSLSRALEVWDEARQAAWAGAIGEGTAPTPEAAESLWQGRFLTDPGVDELELVRAYYDMERFEGQTLTLALLPAGTANRPMPPMSGPVREAVLGLVRTMGPKISHLNVVWTGRNPLEALAAVADVSLGCCELAEAMPFQYQSVLMTSGEGLLPPLLEKLPALGIDTVELRFDGKPDGALCPPLVLAHLEAALDVPGLTVQLRLHLTGSTLTRMHRLLDDLEALGLAGRGNLGVVSGEAVFRSCHQHRGCTVDPQLRGGPADRFWQRAQQMGLAAAAGPPRFLGLCQAVQLESWVVLASGELHKCWATAASARLRAGHLLEPESLQMPDPQRQRWASWNPFQDDVCRSCSLLPLCVGNCAHRFIHRDPELGEDFRPCPSWKTHLSETVKKMARSRGLV